MKRLTRRSKVNEALPTKHLNLMHMDTTSEDTLTDILEKLAYYEDLEERISSIYEEITIEMIVDEIESEHNKSIENILNLCKKLKEME